MSAQGRGTTIMAWSGEDIPDQTGRLAVVTGSTGGLGLETARALVGAGAEVVVAARDPAKGAAAVGDLGPRARFERLDLADLASVEDFAARLEREGRPLDLLVNNAGVMAPPDRVVTKEGFELQFGTNHLGPFALTGRLLPLLRRAAAARVVSVASVAARLGALDFGDLQSERRYSAWRAYGRSKLADLMFARELDRRSRSDGWGVRSVAAHPGWSRTDLMTPRPGMKGHWLFAPSKLVEGLFSQSAAAGAAPILFAATAPDAKPGGYYGPQGAGEMKGPVGPAAAPRAAASEADAARLWEESERLTGVRYG